MGQRNPLLAQPIDPGGCCGTQHEIHRHRNGSAILPVFKKCAFDPMVESTDGRSAPYLVVNLSGLVTAVGPVRASAKVGTKYEGHLVFGIFFGANDLLRVTFAEKLPCLIPYFVNR